MLWWMDQIFFIATCVILISKIHIDNVMILSDFHEHVAIEVPILHQLNIQL